MRSTAIHVNTVGCYRQADVCKHRVIPPDPEIRKQREAICNGLRALAEQLEELISTSTEMAETEFWQAALKRLKGF